MFNTPGQNKKTTDTIFKNIYIYICGRVEMTNN